MAEELFDTHIHLLDERFDKDRAEVIAALPEKGVGLAVECSSNLAESRRAAELAAQTPVLYAAVGVHPHSADEWNDAAEKELRELLKLPKVVAVGEIGLDYHYDFSPREVQKRVFERQIEIAQEENLPFVVHSREATADTLEILRRHPGAHGELHCFSGSAETAEELVRMGYYIAFGGALTFKNARKAIAAAQAVPPECLLIETDCPYMTPVPFRGQRNEPAYVRLVAEKLSEITGMETEDVIRLTRENGRRFFGI